MSPEAASRDWLTIKEAAEYLEVSQPTIFRWMKSGLLSFYKVGGSTRFEKKGLDAVAEKRTGSREAKVARGRCASCGHDELVDGRVQGTGLLYFRPKRLKFWTFGEGMVPTHAMACTACGYVQMHLNTDKLRSLMPEDDTK